MRSTLTIEDSTDQKLRLFAEKQSLSYKEAVNLPVYAHNRAVAHHPRAKAWWEQCLNGSEPIGLAAVVVLGFVRSLSSPKVVEVPVRQEILLSAASRWLDCPAVRLVGPVSGISP